MSCLIVIHITSAFTSKLSIHICFYTNNRDMSAQNSSLKEASKKQASSLARKNIRKFVNNRLAMIGMIFVVIIVLASIFAPLLTPYDPAEISLGEMSLSPCLKHPLGTDKLGRDVFSRVLYGGRISIFVGVVGALSGSLIGMVLGSIAGYFGGKIDTVLIRISEIFQTFPEMILIMILVGILGQGVGNLILVFSVTGWMTTFRMVRNEFLALREETYVQVCEAFGMSKASIMFKQILPNVLSPVIVATTVNVAGFILSEASLSFLGVGVPSSQATWGNILNAAKSVEVVSNYWWLWAVPGVVISIFVLAINFFGDGLRDVLDPKQQ